MRRTGKIGIDKNTVPLKRVLDDSGRLQAMLAASRETMTGYLAELKKPGMTFDKKFSTLLYDLPVLPGMLMTLPMNFVLWLYELGNSGAESRKLYVTLGEAANEALRLPKTDLSVDKADFPISGSMKRHMCRPAEAFCKSMRSFNPLQMLITSLCFSICGRRGVFEGEFVARTLRTAAPLVGDVLPDDAAGETHYRAGFSEGSAYLNTMLLATLDAGAGRLLVKCLLDRVTPFYDSGTRLLPREELAARLLTYLRQSLLPGIIPSKDVSACFSNSYLW